MMRAHGGLPGSRAIRRCRRNNAHAANQCGASLESTGLGCATLGRSPSTNRERQNPCDIPQRAQPFCSAWRMRSSSSSLRDRAPGDQDTRLPNRGSAASGFSFLGTFPTASGQTATLHARWRAAQKAFACRSLSAAPGATFGLIVAIFCTVSTSSSQRSSRALNACICTNPKRQRDASRGSARWVRRSHPARPVPGRALTCAPESFQKKAVCSAASPLIFLVRHQASHRALRSVTCSHSGLTEYPTCPQICPQTCLATQSVEGSCGADA